MFGKVKKSLWYEEEAEANYMTVEEYFKLLKLEKENAELKCVLLERKIKELEDRSVGNEKERTEGSNSKECD